MGWRGTAPTRRVGRRYIPFALKDEPMDTMVTMALVGTAQQPDKDTGTGTPIDTLTAGFSGREMERRILLAHGLSTSRPGKRLGTCQRRQSQPHLGRCAPAHLRLPGL